MVIISHIIPPIVKHITELLTSQIGETKKNLIFLIKDPFLNIMEYELAICANISTNDHQSVNVKQVAARYSKTIIPKINLFFKLSSDTQ